MSHIKVMGFHAETSLTKWIRSANWGNELCTWLKVGNSYYVCVWRVAYSGELVESIDKVFELLTY